MKPEKGLNALADVNLLLKMPLLSNVEPSEVNPKRPSAFSSSLPSEISVKPIVFYLVHSTAVNVVNDKNKKKILTFTPEVVA